MDIEQAEKRTKILLVDKCNCSECLKNKEAMQTVEQFEQNLYKSRKSYYRKNNNNILED